MRGLARMLAVPGRDQRACRRRRAGAQVSGERRGGGVGVEKKARCPPPSLFAIDGLRLTPACRTPALLQTMLQCGWCGAINERRPDDDDDDRVDHDDLAPVGSRRRRAMRRVAARALRGAARPLRWLVVAFVVILMAAVGAIGVGVVIPRAFESPVARAAHSGLAMAMLLVSVRTAHSSAPPLASASSLFRCLRFCVRSLPAVCLSTLHFHALIKHTHSILKSHTVAALCRRVLPQPRAPAGPSRLRGRPAAWLLCAGGGGGGSGARALPAGRLRGLGLLPPLPRPQAAGRAPLQHLRGVRRRARPPLPLHQQRERETRGILRQRGSFQCWSLPPAARLSDN